MTTSTEDVTKILTQLDSGNDDHWTDDGAPSLEAVQLIGNDTTITRDQVNKAIPGFSRAGSDEEPIESDLEDKGTLAQKSVVEPRAASAGPQKAPTNLDHEDEYNLDPKDPLSDAPALSQDRVKEIMQRRVENAQKRLDGARAAVTDAQAFVSKAEAFHSQAVAALHKAFPPIHTMDAIKEHLRRSMEHRAAQAGVPNLYSNPNPDRPASALDARMSVRDKRQVRRPA